MQVKTIEKHWQKLSSPTRKKKKKLLNNSDCFDIWFTTSRRTHIWINIIYTEQKHQPPKAKENLYTK